MPAKPKSTIIPFRPRDRLQDEEELPVSLPPAAMAAPVSSDPVRATDLTNDAKVWLVIGPGRAGKTMLLRWVAEMSLAKGSAPIVAAADPQNRSLQHYMDVHQPPTNDATATARWLESLLRHCMDERASALVDLGGGDTALHKMLTTVPTLDADMVGSSVAPVAVYLVGPRVDDLASLGSFEAMGFKPGAVAIVCNEGLADPTEHRDDAFARVKRHSIYRSAVDRGAVPLWMPALAPHDLVQEIESKRLSFLQARDAISPSGRTVAPLAPFDRSRVRTWLERMEAEMAPIASWLP